MNHAISENFDGFSDIAVPEGDGDSVQKPSIGSLGGDTQERNVQIGRVERYPDAGTFSIRVSWN